MAPATKAQVIIESQLKSQIDVFCSSGSGSCGLIIGQALEGGRFLVAHFVRASKDPETHTASPDGDPQRFELDGGGSGKSSPGGETVKNNGEKDAGAGDRLVDGTMDSHWMLARKRNFYSCSDVRDLTAARLPSLSRQVSRLLPGGLSVLGIFLTSPAEIPKTSRPKLKEILMDISSVIRKDCPALHQDAAASDDKVILAFDPRSKQTNTSLYLDAADAKSITKPIPVTFSSLSWLALHTHFNINLEQPTATQQDVETVLEHVLNTFTDQVTKSVCLYDQRCLEPSSVLKSATDAVEVSMLVPMPRAAGWEEDEGIAVGGEVAELANGHMAFRGDVVGRAYVAQGGTVGFAEKVVKADLLRSMTTRIELHCEDNLVTEADEQEFDVVHELPRRVLAPLNIPDCPITLSNYVHEDEETRESLEIFVGLLDMDAQLSTRQLITDVEHVPSQRDVDSALESVSTHSGEIEAETGVAGEEEANAHGHGGAVKVIAVDAQQNNRMQNVMVVLAVVFAVTFALYQIYLFVYAQDDSPPSTSLPGKSEKEL
ncbi:protein odr-4 homolog [Paramacrobiotus metropolitanus]|uniref:protein odr-4 homolog n=1 Tax=Paramacrobiotus metropolitanus TaxID=2943436 RepID=UPI002445BF8E|nr:protein odr-4 homolog [Paramacrobiotus metropolitanus]